MLEKTIEKRHWAFGREIGSAHECLMKTVSDSLSSPIGDNVEWEFPFGGKFETSSFQVRGFFQYFNMTIIRIDSTFYIRYPQVFYVTSNMQIFKTIAQIILDLIKQTIIKNVQNIGLPGKFCE